MNKIANVEVKVTRDSPSIPGYYRYPGDCQVYLCTQVFTPPVTDAKTGEELSSPPINILIDIETGSVRRLSEGIDFLLRLYNVRISMSANQLTIPEGPEPERPKP